jgi:hypothetical protein
MRSGPASPKNAGTISVPLDNIPKTFSSIVGFRAALLPLRLKTGTAVEGRVPKFARQHRMAVANLKAALGGGAQHFLGRRAGPD